MRQTKQQSIGDKRLTDLLGRLQIAPSARWGITGCIDTSVGPDCLLLGRGDRLRRLNSGAKYILGTMTIAEVFLAEFDQEMRSTRRMLECIRADVLQFQPHPKSMTLARLAGHIAEMPEWGTNTAKLDSLDINPDCGPGLEPYSAINTTDLLAFFDKNVAAAHEAIGEVSNEGMHAVWTLLSGGTPLFTLPRIAVLKSMILNHIIHHRAQLSVYLRMEDITIPGMYGPSADDKLLT